MKKKLFKSIENSISYAVYNEILQYLNFNKFVQFIHEFKLVIEDQVLGFALNFWRKHLTLRAQAQVQI